MIQTKDSRAFQEKRKHTRYDFIQATFFRLDTPESEPHPCQVRNLSFGGLLMECRDRMEPGQQILIIINLDGMILKERMKIMHCSENGNSGIYGCQFQDSNDFEIRNRELMQYTNRLN